MVLQETADETMPMELDEPEPIEDDPKRDYEVSLKVPDHSKTDIHMTDSLTPSPSPKHTPKVAPI